MCVRSGGGKRITEFFPVVCEITLTLPVVFLGQFLNQFAILFLEDTEIPALIPRYLINVSEPLLDDDSPEKNFDFKTAPFPFSDGT